MAANVADRSTSRTSNPSRLYVVTISLAFFGRNMPAFSSRSTNWNCESAANMEVGGGSGVSAGGAGVGTGVRMGAGVGGGSVIGKAVQFTHGAVLLTSTTTTTTRSIQSEPLTSVALAHANVRLVVQFDWTLVPPASPIIHLPSTKTALVHHGGTAEEQFDGSHVITVRLDVLRAIQAPFSNFASAGHEEGGWTSEQTTGSIHVPLINVAPGNRSQRAWQPAETQRDTFLLSMVASIQEPLMNVALAHAVVRFPVQFEFTREPFGSRTVQ